MELKIGVNGYKIRRLREIESVENPSKIAWNWAYSKTYI